MGILSNKGFFQLNDRFAHQKVSTLMSHFQVVTAWWTFLELRGSCIGRMEEDRPHDPCSRWPSDGIGLWLRVFFLRVRARVVIRVIGHRRDVIVCLLLRVEETGKDTRRWDQWHARKEVWQKKFQSGCKASHSAEQRLTEFQICTTLLMPFLSPPLRIKKIHICMIRNFPVCHSSHPTSPKPIISWGLFPCCGTCAVSTADSRLTFQKVYIVF
jgi:hypothetical protein